MHFVPFTGVVISYMDVLLCYRYDASVSYQEAGEGEAPTDVDDRDILVTTASVDGKMRYFDYQHYRYIWDVQKRTFKELE